MGNHNLENDTFTAQLLFNEELEYCENDVKNLEDTWPLWVPNNFRRRLGMCTRRPRAIRKARRNKETSIHKTKRLLKMFENLTVASAYLSDALNEFSRSMMNIYSKVSDTSIMTDLSESEIFSRIHSMLEENPDKTFDEALSDILESERRN